MPHPCDVVFVAGGSDAASSPPQRPVQLYRSNIAPVVCLPALKNQETPPRSAALSALRSAPSDESEERVGNLNDVNSLPRSRLRVAAIRFLNPAPLMWDFDHPPQNSVLARRYDVQSMLPSACAHALVTDAADIGLIPIAALATSPHLRILPGSTIASKGRVRSLILVQRASQTLGSIRTVAADTASRTTVAYARILFHLWGNPAVRFIPANADLDGMLGVAAASEAPLHAPEEPLLLNGSERTADAAILIGDAALLALEDRARRFERTGEELVYHDLAELWRKQTGLVWVSAVWSIADRNPSSGARPPIDETIIDDFNQSRLHGLENIDALVAEWSHKLPLPTATIRTYLTENIHYTLDEECIEGMRGFFRLAAEMGVLPQYTFSILE